MMSLHSNVLRKTQPVANSQTTFSQLFAGRTLGSAVAVVVVGAAIGVGVVVAAITGRSQLHDTSHNRCSNSRVGVVVAVGVGGAGTVVAAAVMVALAGQRRCQDCNGRNIWELIPELVTV